MFDMLHSHVSYSAIGREFNVNKSTIYIKCLQTETHIKQGYIVVG